MSASSSTEADTSRTPPAWVSSFGGPLLAVPSSALAEWGGCTDEGMIIGDSGAPDDYDRACEVEGLAGLVPVGGGGAQALVLGDMPSRSCYLPEHRVFLRWLAADSEARLGSAAAAVLADPATEWEECGVWVTDGPAVLMDATTPGVELAVAYAGGGLPEQAPVPLPSGRWRVGALQAWADEHTWVGLVRLLPTDT
ncbi:hypothetical protein A6A08_05165 [Nocardiopsis sp. TSRI0078]|uniref:Imm21 family immunity protein n=1 Tax=unclassified Nocardiopsis TaxID=2649073 RepID=UPI0009404AC5|nr:Imm21 family immunity protein [Nocardiopsis sp. TSRI0078]OKI18996.1 hypothetical protein A6A08_05165 [Nocardiopsis sp. TSRI0078]